MTSHKSKIEGRAFVETEDTSETGRRGPSYLPRSTTDTSSDGSTGRASTGNPLLFQSFLEYREPIKSSTPRNKMPKCDTIDRKHESPGKMKTNITAADSSRAGIYKRGNDLSGFLESLHNADQSYSSDSYSSFSVDNGVKSDSSYIDDISNEFKNCTIDRSTKSETTGNSHIDFKFASVNSFIWISKVLTSSEYITWKKTILSWKEYENYIEETYGSGLSYTYLLLDPRITQKLPNKNDAGKNRIEVWTTFINSIFYIGKGSSYARPTSHLKNAMKMEHDKCSPKEKKIWDIWNEDMGVVCVQVFHHVSSDNAYIREAAMIDAVGLNNLTNKNNGVKNYPEIQNWKSNNKLRKLGCYLLFRAMRVYLNDGERQLKCIDLNNTFEPAMK